MRHRAADEGAFQPAVEHLLHQLAGGAGPQRQVHCRIGRGEGGQGRREPQCGGGLERAQDQCPLRRSIVAHGPARILQQARMMPSA